MKKILFVVVAMLLSIPSLFAEERVINEKALPKNAKAFIAEHFKMDKISIATEERDGFGKDYKVILTSGVKIEFDKNGNWTDVECKRNRAIPAKIVPEKIAKYVKGRFPSNVITQIDRDRRGIEVELNNGVELKFNNNGDLIKFDN